VNIRFNLQDYEQATLSFNVIFWRRGVQNHTSTTKI